MGFPWVMGYNERWNNNFNELVAYDKANGSVDVQKSNGELGRWVHNQRQAYKFFNSGKKSTLTPERIERLESIGFKWRVLMALTRPGIPSSNFCNSTSITKDTPVSHAMTRYLGAGLQRSVNNSRRSKRA